MMSSSSSSTVVYEGWMVRYGRRALGRSFVHTRYFILDTRSMCYYKRNPSRSQIGPNTPVKSLQIDGNCRVEDRGLKMHHGHMLYVLCVCNKMNTSNSITMAAFNIQEALIWKEKLEMVIDQISLSLSLSSQQNNIFDNGRRSSSEYESLDSYEEEEEEDNRQSLQSRETTIANGTHHNEYEALEQTLFDSSAEPIELSYRFLKNITNGFSEVIGSGGFGEVYMGVLRSRRVAVKKLFQTTEFSDKQFEEELTCLRRVKHKNIVRFLGYCSDTQQKLVMYQGQFVLAEDRRRFLCFEYVPNKSLHDYLKDESYGREWRTHYQLIEGICQGLRYLHNEERITHLDLKPQNILLDADMVPKITDFGLSRRFSGEQSRIITENVRGSRGYIAPEYLSKGEISFKSDIFSLGIIIRKLLLGSNNLSDFENRNQSDWTQVKTCIKMSELCVDEDQRKRPTIDCIIDMLSEVCPVEGHSRNNSWSSEQQLQVITDSAPVLGIRDLIPAKFREFRLFRQ